MDKEIIDNSIPSVFVSHKGCDAEFAKKIASDLRMNGVHSWLDIWNMPPGKALTDAMQDGLMNCDVMVLILTPESMKSLQLGIGGIAFEVHLGEGRTFSNNKFRIIGLLLEECNPPEKLKNRIGRWLDFRDKNDYNVKLKELCKWIKDPEADLGPPVIQVNLSEKKMLEFIECINSNSNKKVNYTTKGVSLRFDFEDNIGKLLVWEDTDDGYYWEDYFEHYYLKRSDFFRIIRLLNDTGNAYFTGECVYYGAQSRHDQYYPDDDFRSESVEKGKLMLDVSITDNNFKINSLEFKSFHNSYRESVHGSKDSEALDFARKILKD